MKKNLLLILLLTIIQNTSFSQVVYVNDFSNGTGLTFIDADGDGVNWGFYLSNASSVGFGITGGFAGSTSWTSTTGPQTPNNFLITPSIVIPTSAQATTLTFKLGSTGGGTLAAPSDFAEKISIYVFPSTQTTVAQIIANTPVFTLVLTAANFRTALSQSITISSYAGQTVKVAIRHHDCTDQNLLYFDDLKIYQGTLSTSEFISNKFSISPNPTNSLLNINSSENIGVSAVSITDLNGRVIRNVAFNGVSDIQLNVSDLSSGMYMLNIKSEQGTATKKFIKN